MGEYDEVVVCTSRLKKAAKRQNSRRVPSPTKSAAASPAGGGGSVGWPSLYGNQPTADLNKDAFLGQYIHRIYCRECREQETMAAAANQQAGGSSSQGSNPNSPPQYQMDQMSLSTAMDANKEALTRRLMLRRSVNELVNAGIYPSLKTPVAFAGQRLHLERAKTGDILKHKIEQRPDRDFLVQQHILEVNSNVDPSLASTQRKLKKAKLTDELNEKLAHRPGPLELVEQCILEADDPLKTALKEGKLEFHKTEEGVEPAVIPKVPYEIESPKSGHSSPEPDCDNDSNSSSNQSTGFQPTTQQQVPSPPDIAPLLTATQGLTSVTIGGKTLKIPITTQSFIPPPVTTFTVAPQTFSSIQRQPSSFGASRNHRRTTRLNRPNKAQFKPKVIKFHEYKGPPTSKSSNLGGQGQFVTTTGPLQPMESLSAYQVRVQQQQLYLQCQLEIQSKDSISSAVLVPIQAPPTPMIPVPSPAPQAERQEISPPRHVEVTQNSRPVTPSLSMKSPSMPQIHNHHKTLQLTRSLSQLEDLKVADLKHELKQRSLAVSGSKPQLIERLRNYQLQEMSVSIPSVSSSSGSEFNYSTSIPSVQSFTDETMMAPPSVMSNRVMSPPPCSPREDYLRSPPSVMSQKSTGMETEDNSGKSTADIVREQAKQIEDLQRRLMQFQQQYPAANQPMMSPPATVVMPKIESISQPTSPQHIQITPQQLKDMAQQHQQRQSAQQAAQQAAQQQKLSQRPVHQLQTQQLTQQAQQQTPVDITDKQVYLATPDGKMTAYKVILHTGNGIVHQPQSKSTTQTSQQPTKNTLSKISPGSSMKTQPAPQPQIHIPETHNAVSISLPTKAELQQDSITNNRHSQGINVDDVLEVLISTGEMDAAMMNGQGSPSLVDSRTIRQPSSFNDQNLANSQQLHSLGTNNQPELEEPFSPLPNMDWMDADPSDSLDLEGLDEEPAPPTFDTNDSNSLIFSDDNGSLDWLSDVMQLDSDPSTSTQTHRYDNIICDNNSSDPVLACKPQPPDVMSIFHMEESDFRPEPVSSLYWDKLSSQHL